MNKEQIKILLKHFGLGTAKNSAQSVYGVLGTRPINVPRVEISVFIMKNDA